jgi:transcriptional regulator with XRE-family HTH domain
MTESDHAHLFDLLGRKIAARRSYLRLTMRDIKAQTGIDIATLSRYEHGRVSKGYRLDILVKLAIALEMPLEEMLAPFIGHVRDNLGGHYT